MSIISSINVGDRVDGASGFEIMHLKPLNPLTLMVKLLNLTLTGGDRMVKKGGSKVRVLRQGGACNSVTNGPNNLKFCMQGAFVCYY